MELVFFNARGTHKLCLKVNEDCIWDLTSEELDRLNQILELNKGYTWIPVLTGYAKENKLPIVV